MVVEFRGYWLVASSTGAWSDFEFYYFEDVAKKYADGRSGVHAIVALEWHRSIDKWSLHSRCGWGTKDRFIQAALPDAKLGKLLDGTTDIQSIVLDDLTKTYFRLLL